MKTGTKIGLVGLAIGVPALGYWAYTRSKNKKKEKGEDWDDTEPEEDWDIDLQDAVDQGLVDDSASSYTEQEHTRDDVSYSWDPGRSFSPFTVRTSRILSCRR